MGIANVELIHEKQSLLPNSLHIYLILTPPHAHGNPMAISTLLNPSDDEDDEGSLKSEPTSLSMTNHEISRRHSQSRCDDRSFSGNGLRLPLRPISSRRERSDSYEDCSRRRQAVASGPDRMATSHHNYHERQRDHTRYQRRHSRQRSAPPSSSPSRRLDGSAKTPHSNKAYTKEQVDFIRYTKEDLDVPWKGFPARFRQFWTDLRDSDQCFSSRHYRSNIKPRHENWVPILVDGRPIMDPAPVRGRSTPEGKAEDFPYTLIELCPHRALDYSWVSPVDKARALEVLRTDEIRDKMLENGTFVDPDPKNSKCTFP
jgi:hypothetical protein